MEGQKNDKYDQSRKGFRPSNFGNQQKQPSQAGSKPTRVVGESPIDPQQNREPLQCWKCGGSHMHRNSPLEDGNARPYYNVQEVKTVGQVARVVPMQHWRTTRKIIIQMWLKLQVILLSNMFLF